MCVRFMGMKIKQIKDRVVDIPLLCTFDCGFEKALTSLCP